MAPWKCAPGVTREKPFFNRGPNGPDFQFHTEFAQLTGRPCGEACHKRTFLLLAMTACSACAAGNSAPDHAHLFTVTAYCHCAKCCGRANQPAADGRQPVAGLTIAGPRCIPLGTHVLIEGIGERIVTDRLAPEFDTRFDIYMTTHHAAKQFGIQQLQITILP